MGAETGTNARRETEADGNGRMEMETAMNAEMETATGGNNVAGKANGALGNPVQHWATTTTTMTKTDKTNKTRNQRHQQHCTQRRNTHMNECCCMNTTNEHLNNSPRNPGKPVGTLHEPYGHGG